MKIVDFKAVEVCSTVVGSSYVYIRAISVVYLFLLYITSVVYRPMVASQTYAFRTHPQNIGWLSYGLCISTSCYIRKTVVGRAVTVSKPNMGPTSYTP